MADYDLQQPGQLPSTVRIKYADMGDGTHALTFHIGDYATRELGIARINSSYDGTNWEAPRLDASTFALDTVGYAHHEIHSGAAYSCHYYQMVSDTNDRSIIAFRTGNTAKWGHMIAEFSASAPALVKILEAPTVTNNTGATLAVFNRNRNSVNTSDVWDTSQNPDVQGQATYFTEATMGSVSGGTEIEGEYLASGTRNFTGGGANRGVAEWVLKQNTLYAFEVTALNDDDNYHSIKLDWYEHTDLA